MTQAPTIRKSYSGSRLAGLVIWLSAWHALGAGTELFKGLGSPPIISVKRQWSKVFHGHIFSIFFLWVYHDLIRFIIQDKLNSVYGSQPQMTLNHPKAMNGFMMLFFDWVQGIPQSFKRLRTEPRAHWEAVAQKIHPRTSKLFSDIFSRVWKMDQQNLKHTPLIPTVGLLCMLLVNHFLRPWLAGTYLIFFDPAEEAWWVAPTGDIRIPNSSKTLVAYSLDCLYKESEQYLRLWILLE